MSGSCRSLAEQQQRSLSSHSEETLQRERCREQVKKESSLIIKNVFEITSFKTN